MKKKKKSRTVYQGETFVVGSIRVKLLRSGIRIQKLSFCICFHFDMLQVDIKCILH